jgi:haloacetate dehalogenase
MTAFANFASREIPTSEATIFVRLHGAGPPLLLLHGFPETHLMWRDVAAELAETFTLVCADLRGYGQSGCPPSDASHAAYAKRAMARDMLEVMEALGFRRFFVAGHDRGGRVAYRMALDHPHRVDRLAVLDVIPTAALWQRADAHLMLAFWPWSLLAQPEPLPERVLMRAADAVVDDALSQWGSAPHAFPPDVRLAYIEALQRDLNAHAICEEYRAAASIDREHDEADLASGRRIACPVLALWSRGGALDVSSAAQEGVLALWRRFAPDITGRAVDGGHFFPETRPAEASEALRDFFRPAE